MQSFLANSARRAVQFRSADGLARAARQCASALQLRPESATNADGWAAKRFPCALCAGAGRAAPLPGHSGSSGPAPPSAAADEAGGRGRRRRPGAILLKTSACGAPAQPAGNVVIRDSVALVAGRPASAAKSAKQGSRMNTPEKCPATGAEGAARALGAGGGRTAGQVQINGTEIPD